jgi:heme oxygenase
MAVATSIKDIREASGCVQLRKATHAVHEALHRAPLLAAFEGQQLDVQGYGRIMQIFHQFYCTLDPLIAQAMPLLKHYANRFSYQPRAPMFARDIGDLECLFARQETNQPGWSGSLPSLDNASALAGAIYVVEGSILGGSGLDRCARKVLQSDDLAGRRYWQWCRDNASMRWKATQQMINEVWFALDEGELMIASANAVFGDLLSRFEQAPVTVSRGLEVAQ